MNFRAARRRLRVALAASVVVPLGLLLLYASYTYHRTLEEESATLNRFAWIAEGKVTNLFDLNWQLIERAENSIGQRDCHGISQDVAYLHAVLASLVSTHPQIATLSIVDANGKLIVSSRYFPTPTVSIGARQDFISTRATLSRFFISLPQRSLVQGIDIVSSLSARVGHDGRFLGAIVISLRRDYLLRFYTELHAEHSAVTVGLYRDDGGILVRFPPPLVPDPPTTHDILAKAFAQNPRRDILKIDSPLDGKPKLISYRKAGPYPVYVSAGLAMQDIIRDWLREDMSIVLVALIPCIFSWVLILFSLRRLQAEESSWRNWRRELGRRQTAEVAARRMQRMGALGNLVASVAHDFNNLLMVVTANMEIVRRKGYKGVKSEVDAVERASTTARALARRLMSVARRAPLRIQTILPSQWLAETNPLVRSSLRDDVALHISASDSVWMIAVDASELTSALINIAVNANDAMPHGGCFSIGCNNVTFATSRHGLTAGDYVEFICEDSGTGMAPEVQSHAFEPLFTTKPAGIGTGLGLAQVAAMAEQGGGTARIESTVGRGTVVFFYLPRANEEAVAHTRTQATEPCSLTAESNHSRPILLLVEDNEEVAAGLLAVVDVLGWKARHAPTGDAALEVLKEDCAFDLILSDIQMPGTCDGIGLVEWIKQWRPTQAVTLMTGYAEHIEKARQLGVAVLSKPFNADDLATLLSSIRPTKVV
nr:hybrid sensor histidine kinase/response regulator [Caballeronia sp. GACF4]